MTSSAIVVVGNIAFEDEKKLCNELNDLQKEGGQRYVFVITETATKKSEFLFGILKSNVHMIDCQDKSYVHGIYEVKRSIDQARISDCLFLLPQSLQEYFVSACTLLFTSKYNIQFSISDNLNNEIEVGNCDEENVRSYLKSIPGNEDHPLKIYSSKVVSPLFLHGYSSKQGGVSTFPDQASLNMCYSLKKKDPLLVVMENRARLAQTGKFDNDNFYIAKAVHGKDVWVFEDEEPASYDAIITNTPGVTVAAPGADCNILLFSDPSTMSCGAAHAGWKGILKGIVQSTVMSMVEKYGTDPQNLVVTLGPSLSVCCCEFGVEESKQFLNIHENCVVWKNGFAKPFLNLRLAVRILLESLGVISVNIDDGQEFYSNLNVCTKCDPLHRFFSFRRVGPQFGNQVGYVGLPIR